MTEQSNDSANNPQPDRPPIGNAAQQTQYSPPPPYGGPPPGWSGESPKRGNAFVAKIVGSLLLLSIGLNIYMGLFVAAQFSGGPAEAVYQEGDVSQRIVIVPVTELITESTARGLRASFKALRDNPPKAVVLRVDSGGGTVGASDRIHHEIMKFKEATGVPVVASFGSLAASGGYYIAAPTDYIFAENTTVTGSIGVMAQAFTVEGLLEKVGVSPEVHVASTSPEKAVANDIMHAWTDKDRNLLGELLDHSHQRFIDVVYEGRQKHLTREEVIKIADGSIYMTEQAIENKLVDERGYLDAAIEKAKALAGMSASDEPQVTVISPAKPLNLMSLMGARRNELDLQSITGADLRNILTEMTSPRLEYRMPALR